uniref:CASP-like protein n=1 Tax=Kalanchoe fedtschenkoi TaxID=63787 RepID=A0A7N0UC09_KALFE
MTNSEESKAPAAADVENQQAPAPAAGVGGGVSEIVGRWKREDLVKRGCVALRGLALLFSFLSFVIMATNKHGDGRNFDQYEEYRYVLAIAVLSFLYTAAQSLKHVYELSAARTLVQPRTAALVDFFGDQTVAYLLMSAASAAIPMTNRIREGADNIFTDSCSSSISMSFFAFFSLALSAMIAGYKLSTQHTYI